MQRMFQASQQTTLMSHSCTSLKARCCKSSSSTRVCSVRISAVLQRPRPSTDRKQTNNVPRESEPILEPPTEYLQLTSKLQHSPTLDGLDGLEGVRSFTAAGPRRTDTVWHFAYGANMNFYTLARRGVRVISRESAFVRDERVHIVFKHRGGYATLARLADGQVLLQRRFTRHAHGVLYEITKEDLKKLEASEGGYVVKEFEVETYDGRIVRALSFVSGPMSTLPQEVAPTEKYMMVLRDGAGDNYLEPLHQAWLSSIPTVPSVGLPAHYYDTPAKYLAYGFVASCACILLSFHIQ